MQRLTPFAIFYCEHRDVVASMSPNAAPVDISRTIAEKWRALPEHTRREYSLMAAAYTESVATHGSEPPPPAKRLADGAEHERRAPQEPRIASTAFAYFRTQQRPRLLNQNQDLSFAGVDTAINAQWNAMTAEQRKPFEDAAVEDEKRYNREMESYRMWEAQRGSDAASSVDPRNPARDNGSAAAAAANAQSNLYSNMGPMPSFAGVDSFYPSFGGDASCSNGGGGSSSGGKLGPAGILHATNADGSGNGGKGGGGGAAAAAPRPAGPAGSLPSAAAPGYPQNGAQNHPAATVGAGAAAAAAANQGGGAAPMYDPNTDGAALGAPGAMLPAGRSFQMLGFGAADVTYYDMDEGGQ